MNDISKKSSNSNIMKELRGILDKELVRSGDSRVTGSNPEIWETYPRFSEIRSFPAVQNDKTK